MSVKVKFVKKHELSHILAIPKYDNKLLFNFDNFKNTQAYATKY